MSKYIVGFLLVVIFAMLFIFYGTADCVVNRAEAGILVDWALIKDCTY
jgi:hypothetical protein